MTVLGGGTISYEPGTSVHVRVGLGVLGDGWMYLGVQVGWLSRFKDEGRG